MRGQESAGRHPKPLRADNTMFFHQILKIGPLKAGLPRGLSDIPVVLFQRMGQEFFFQFVDCIDSNIFFSLFQRFVGLGIDSGMAGSAIALSDKNRSAAVISFFHSKSQIVR